MGERVSSKPKDSQSAKLTRRRFLELAGNATVAAALAPFVSAFARVAEATEAPAKPLSERLKPAGDESLLSETERSLIIDDRALYPPQVHFDGETGNPLMLSTTCDRLAWRPGQWVGLRGIRTDSGIPTGPEIDPFKGSGIEGAADAKTACLGKFEGVSAFLVAASEIRPGIDPLPPAVDRVAARFVVLAPDGVRTMGDTYRLFAPGLSNGDIPESSFWDIAPSPEKDGSFVASAVYPLSLILGEEASIAERVVEQDKAQVGVEKVGADLFADRRDEIKTKAEALGSNDVLVTTKLKVDETGNLTVQGFDFDLIDPFGSGLKILSQPDGKTNLLYYAGEKLMARSCTSGKMGGTTEIPVTGTLREAIYDNTSGKILATTVEPEGAWHIAAIDPQKSYDVADTPFDFPDDLKGRKVSSISLLPVESSVLCLTRAHSYTQGSGLQMQVGLAVWQDGKLSQKLNFLEESRELNGATALAQGKLLLARFQPGAEEGKSIAVVQPFTTEGPYKIFLPFA